MEAAQAAQAADARRVTELESELDGERRELDGARFECLREHEIAISLVIPAIPPSEAAELALLSTQLESAKSHRHALSARWGWDDMGRVPASEGDLLGIGGVEEAVGEAAGEAAG